MEGDMGICGVAVLRFILETTTSHKLLGVYIDSDLSFNEHVEHLCEKLAIRIGVLRSIRHQ